MTVNLSEFAVEVERFVQRECPPALREKVRRGDKLGRADLSQWQRILHDRGWGAPSWPVEHGGTGWDAVTRHTFEEVLSMNDCPTPYHHGLKHIGPVLIKYGSDEQKARYLPRILDGSEWWCQGFSEPQAGSDLASLKMAAVLDGDAYVVNGQKIWTSHAHEADMIYTLVRTARGERKQEGITLLLIPRALEGITVRPIHTIDGRHHVNEVFFDDVRVPVSERVGEDGKGWEYAKYLLQHERLGGANVAPAFKELERVQTYVERELRAPEQKRLRDDLLRRCLLIEADLRGARVLGQEAISLAQAGEPLSILPSILKLISSPAYQDIAELQYEAHGAAEPLEQYWPVAQDLQRDKNNILSAYFYARVRTIYGGSREIQKDIVAKEIFA